MDLGELAEDAGRGEGKRDEPGRRGDGGVGEAGEEARENWVRGTWSNHQRMQGGWDQERERGEAGGSRVGSRRSRWGEGAKDGELEEQGK